MSGDTSTLRLAVVVDAVTANAERGLKSVAAAEKEVASAAATSSKASGAAAEGLDKVAHSSTGVRRELIVLAHEMAMGNYSRFVGSLMVIGERMDAMRYLMSPVGIGLAAMAAGVAAFVAAVVKGSAESGAFNKAIALTGDYAGTTEGQYNALIAAVAAGDGRFAQSRNILEGLVASGRFTSQSLGVVGAAGARLADNTGADADKIVGEFVKMTDGVSKWAAEANRSYHFLTGAQYEHIQGLENQGKVQEAVQATAQALYDHLGGPAAQNVGILQRAWTALGNAVNKAWDDMKSVGRDTTIEERLAVSAARIKDLQRQIAEAQQPVAVEQLDNPWNPKRGPQDPDLARSLQDKLMREQTQLNLLNAQKRKQEADAKTKSDQDQLNETVIAFQNQLKAARDGHQKMLEELQNFEDQYKAKVGIPGGISQDDYNERRRQILAQDNPTVQAHAAMITSIAQAQAALAKAEADNAKQQLDEQLKANQISIQQYYAQRMAIELKALAAERAARATELGVTRSTPAYTQADNDRRTAKEYELQTQLKTLDEQRLAIAQQMSSQKDEQLKSLDKEIAAFIAEGTRKGTDDSEQQIEAFAAKARDIIAKAAQSRPEMIPQLDQALQQGENQIRLDSQTKQIQNLLADLQSKQIFTQTQVQTGDLTPEAGRDQLDQAVQKALDQLKTARAQLMQEAQDAANKSLDTTAITRALDEVQQKINELSKSPFDSLMKSWRDTTTAMEQDTVKWANSGADALTQLATTGKINFRSLTVEVLKDLTEMEIKAALAKLAGAAAGGGSGFWGAILGAFGVGGGAAASGAGGSASASSAMIAAAGGGKVSGPGTRTSDSISARLSDGEYVVRADAVARPGVEQLLDSINGGHITSAKPIRRAAGGIVGNSPGSPAVDDSGSGFSMPLAVHLNVSPDSSLSQADGEALQRKLVPQIQEVTRAVMVSELRPGGILAKVSPASS